LAIHARHGAGDAPQDVQLFLRELRPVQRLLQAWHQLLGRGGVEEADVLQHLLPVLQQAFERYFIAIATLVRRGPRSISASELESFCQLAAQRLSLLYAPAAPEFFDKTLFRGFIAKLRELNLVWLCPNGKLDFDEALMAWDKDAKIVLGRELRQTITHITGETGSGGGRTTGERPAFRG
jgi:glycerol-3-phosphate O-acyltransferase